MANKSFKKYLAESKKEYKFTVKLACDAITDTMLDKIENALAKHDLLTASKFVETPIQKSPLDFPNVRHSKVFISEVSLAYPATTELLRNRVSQMLNISEQQVAIYAENDPRKANTEEYNRFISGETKEGYVPYVGRDYESDPAQEVPAYGKEHTDQMIADVLESRPDANHVYNDLSVPQEVDHGHLTGEQHDVPPVEQTLFGRTTKAKIK